MGDDILLEIFEYLDEKHLINCVKVCTRWNCLIKSFFTPTRLYEKKVFSSNYYFQFYKKKFNHGLLEKMRSSEMWQKYLKVRAQNQVIPRTKYPKLEIAKEVMV